MTMRRTLILTMTATAFASTVGTGRPAAAAPTAEAAPDASAPHVIRDSNGFALHKSDEATKAEAAKRAKLKPTKTEAAVRFTVVDKDKGPMKGVVVSLTAPDGTKYYTDETDADGYAEVLVPVGKKYDLVYLSLAQRNIATNVSVTNEPNQSIRLTLRYKAPPAPPPLLVQAPPAMRFILLGVEFDTAKATLRPGASERLDYVVDFMTHKKSARLEISGHTDNVGNKKANKILSEKRAQTCRDYLIKKGIEASRIVTAGYGDERPIATNDTDAGRQQNRRIEATEL